MEIQGQLTKRLQIKYHDDASLSNAQDLYIMINVNIHKKYFSINSGSIIWVQKI